MADLNDEPKWRDYRRRCWMYVLSVMAMLIGGFCLGKCVRETPLWVYLPLVIPVMAASRYVAEFRCPRCKQRFGGSSQGPHAFLKVCPRCHLWP